MISRCNEVIRNIDAGLFFQNSKIGTRQSKARGRQRELEGRAQLRQIACDTGKIRKRFKVMKKQNKIGYPREITLSLF